LVVCFPLFPFVMLFPRAQKFFRPVL